MAQHKSIIQQLKPILKDSNHPLWLSIERVFKNLVPMRSMKYSLMTYYDALRRYIINKESWGNIGVSLGMSFNTGMVTLPKRIERYLKLVNDIYLYINK